MKNIVLAVALVTGSATDPGTSISDSELSLGGVALGDSESQVVAALGRPIRQSDAGESIAFEYPGLTVLIGWLEQAAPDKSRHVLQLDATGQDACTPSGVCPGAPLSKALALYGQPIRSERESGSFWEYYSSQSSCWLQLGVSGDAVGSISAVCQP
ncbi:conserved hypothetical protein [Luteimonas sp. 9C]|nr:conserved hypothetical protein [Luteimonas sp. 9C]